ncbi:MAG: hydroxymethylbilane synthase [Bilifractor sp.]
MVTISVRTSGKKLSKEAASVESENVLEDSLRNGLTDLSFRSLTEIPYQIPDELPIVAYAKRGEARDALVLPKGKDAPDPERPMATTTRMRAIQLRKLYRGFRFAVARGSIPEMLERLDSGHYSALVLPASDLILSGFSGRISRYFAPEEIMPEVGAGILAAQGRAEEDYSFLSGFSDPKAACEAVSERAFARLMTDGEQRTVSAYAVVQGDHLVLRGLCYDKKLRKMKSGQADGSAEDAGAIGETLAKQFLEEEKKSRRPERKPKEKKKTRK